MKPKKTKLVAKSNIAITETLYKGWLILPGLRRLMPIPWTYQIPNLKLLK